MGVRVHDARNGFVVGLAGFAENVGGDDLALILPYVGQQPHAGDVANGPQTIAGAQVVVDRDAVPVSVNADCVEAYPVDYQTNGWGDLRDVFGSASGGLARTDNALHEWIGLIVYRITGKTSEVVPGPGP